MMPILAIITLAVKSGLCLPVHFVTLNVDPQLINSSYVCATSPKSGTSIRHLNVS